MWQTKKASPSAWREKSINILRSTWTARRRPLPVLLGQEQLLCFLVATRGNYQGWIEHKSTVRNRGKLATEGSQPKQASYVNTSMCISFKISFPAVVEGQLVHLMQDTLAAALTQKSDELAHFLKCILWVCFFENKFSIEALICSCRGYQFLIALWLRRFFIVKDQESCLTSLSLSLDLRSQLAGIHSSAQTNLELRTIRGDVSETVWILLACATSRYQC